MSVTVGLVVDESDSDTVQNDLLLPQGIWIAPQADASPDCFVTATTDLVYSAFTFLPASCLPGVDCLGVRVAIQSTSALGTGQALYTCTAHIAADVAPGRSLCRWVTSWDTTAEEVDSLIAAL